MRHRWAGGLFAALGLLLLPWAFWLGYALPSSHVAHHWDLAWGGFDVVLSLSLLATAWALLTCRPVGRTLAAASGALLLADAWFDVITASGERERWLAVALAAGGEIPLAVICFAVAGAGARRRWKGDEL